MATVLDLDPGVESPRKCIVVKPHIFCGVGKNYDATPAPTYCT
jgi:hypothetical protein